MLFRSVAKPHDSGQWHADVTNGSNELMRTQGVDCANTKIALHVRSCEGLVRHPDGTLQKRFSKTEVVVPMQLCLAAHPRDKSEAEAAKDLGVSEDDDMKVTWRRRRGFILRSLAFRFPRQSHFERPEIWELIRRCRTCEIRHRRREKNSPRVRLSL